LVLKFPWSKEILASTYEEQKYNNQLPDYHGRRSYNWCRILPLTILASRETVAFDTNFACGLYMTVVLVSVLETLLDELLSVVPESST
jgi:hypothetical protein